MAQVHDLWRRWRARPFAACPVEGRRVAGSLGPALVSTLVSTLVLALLLAGCAPVLDWRQFQPEGWPLVVAMPCKPATQQRQVALAGHTVALRMLSCTADGHTFAVVSTDLGDPLRVGPALQALSQSAQANVRAHVLSEQPAAVPGMTPNPAARRWRLRGQLPDGQAVAEQVMVFAHGTRVFQASVIGGQADDARAVPFFDAIQVRQ